METGINAFFIVLLIYLISRRRLLPQPEAETDGMFWIGIVAAATLLSRLDNIFLVLLAGVWLML